MDKVKVLVVAGPNKGKTTIAHIIKEALEAHGFEKIELMDLKVSSDNKEPIAQRLEAAKKRLVEIRVVSPDQNLREVLDVSRET